jgi:putrescine transport system substrate-binding protein
MLLAVLCLCAAGAAAQERVVNVYNWTDYIDPYAIDRFQRETGITVRYDVYDSLETLEGKLLAGRSGYDVVVPTSEPTFSRLVRAGALLPLDRTRLPRLSGLDAALMQRVAMSDPGNRFGAIYLWGSIGLGYNAAKLAALAPQAPRDSWDLLLRPENARLLARCGITLLDSAIDVVPSVLKYLGRSPDSTDAADLAAVEQALLAIRPYVRAFVGAGAVEQLASGEICLALDYSGDVIQAASRAREAGGGVEVRYLAPKEGAQLSFDMLAIPKDAPHPQEALAFIDFVLRPDVMAGITNRVRYPNAVTASLPMVSPDIRDDPGIYPPEAMRAMFFTVGPVPPEAARARSRMWARLKAGR